MNILGLVNHKNKLEENIKKLKKNSSKDFKNFSFDVQEEKEILTNLTEGEINYIINHNPTNIPYDRLSFDGL